MYFINIKQLKQDIINKEFTEKDRFIYAFIYIALYAIDSELSFLFFIENSNNGEDFLGRYFSITWVIIIRLLPLIIIFIGVFIIISMNSIIDSDVLDIAFVLFGFLYGFLIYYFSYGHMLDVAKGESEV